MDDITIYECSDGRTRVYIKDTKKVISYPKYLMEQKLGRSLNDNEQVHHKDANPLNNDPNNLEIKLLGKHQREHGIKYQDEWAICGWCNKPFLWKAKQQRTFNSNRNRKTKTNNSLDVPFCSRKCVGEYGKHIQMNV